MDGYVQGFGNPYNGEPYYDYNMDYNYMEPQIVEAPQYYQDVPPTLGNVAPQQYLNNYADMYSQSNPAISQQYRNLANQAGMRGDAQRNILNWYDGLANDVANRQQYVTDISGNLANNLLGDINNQRDYIYSLYGPNGSITQEVNDYYSGLSNAIAGDTGRQLAQNDVNAKTAGVSVGANRNTQNQIYNEGYERALKAKEADINAKNNIVSALQNYMTALRTEYGDTTDKYIIQKYQQANDLLNQIQSSMTQDMVNLENSKLQFNMQRALQSVANQPNPNPEGGTQLTEEQQNIINSLVADLMTHEDPTPYIEQAKNFGINLGSGSDINTGTLKNLLSYATNLTTDGSGNVMLNLSGDRVVNTPYNISGDNRLYDLTVNNSGNFVRGNTGYDVSSGLNLSFLNGK